MLNCITIFLNLNLCQKEYHPGTKNCSFDALASIQLSALHIVNALQIVDIDT